MFSLRPIWCVFIACQILLDPLQLSETASPGRRRRRRQLGFADAETQIGKLEMKNRLTNTDDITQQFVSNSNQHIII